MSIPPWIPGTATRVARKAVQASRHLRAGMVAQPVKRDQTTNRPIKPSEVDFQSHLPNCEPPGCFEARWARRDNPKFSTSRPWEVGARWRQGQGSGTIPLWIRLAGSMACFPTLTLLLPCSVAASRPGPD